MFKGPKNLFELSWNSRNWVFEFSRVNCVYTTFCNYLTKTEIDRKLRPQATYDKRNVTVLGKFFRDIMKAIHDVIFRFSVSTGFGAIFRSDSNRIWFTSLPFVSFKLKVGFKNLKKNLCTKVLTILSKKTNLHLPLPQEICQWIGNYMDDFENYVCFSTVIPNFMFLA